jgi:hypothetical protein
MAELNLTDEILGPLGPRAVDHFAALLQAAGEIPRRLADLAVPYPGGGSLRLTDHHVRTTLADHEGADPSAPFAWSARTTRRALGLSIVRLLMGGEARTPVDGGSIAVAQAIRSVREGHRPPAPMERWLAGLSTAGLAVVQADAVTWATRLWCALDWRAFPQPPVIGRDHWWDSPHSSLLAIRSRAEVRSVGADETAGPFSTHLVVLGGTRRASVRTELSVVAMVEALRAPRSLPPGRIVGWWPDSGHVVKVEVDRATLEEGVAVVTRILGGEQAALRPFGRSTGAAA